MTSFHRRWGNVLPLLMIWTNSYERLTWTPILVLIALDLDSPASLAYAASAYSAANLVGNLFFGSLSDRFGRHRVAGIALIGLVVTTLIHLRIWSVLAFIVIRLCHGFFSAAVAPSSLAAASDGVARQERGRMMARMGLVIAMASIVASPLSGRLVDALSLTPTLLIQATFLLAVGVIGVLSPAVHHFAKGVERGQVVDARPSSAAGAIRRSDLPQNEGKRPFSGPRALSAFDLRVTISSCVVGFSIMFGQNILFYALPLKAAAARMSPSTIGGFFGVFAIGAAIAFMPPFSRLADRLGRIFPVAVGCALASTGLFFLGRGVADVSVTVMVVSLFVYGFGFGIAFPAVSASTADGAAETRRGLAFGLLTASFSVGSVLGPLVSQALDHVVSPFTVASVVMVSGIAATWLIRGVCEPYGAESKA